MQHNIGWIIEIFIFFRNVTFKSLFTKLIFIHGSEIRTLMELWHDKHEFVSSEHRKQELTRFLNFYNTVRPHSSLTKKDEITGKTLTFTPYEWLKFYFRQSVNNG
ncbi:integrase core domain-containing protein [Moraxella bovis]|uniref:integrase core domain-containing protein n=1 Tax=Moraxella bovis TaxID=476 RepID=UPI00300E369F